MKYTVVWKRSAEAALAEIWLNRRDRDAVRRAADELDRLLARSPHQVGESREGNLRLLVLAPLVVHFAVEDDDYLVRVLKVTELRRPDRAEGSNGKG